MSLLVAMSGWDPQPWVERFGKALPDWKIVTLGEPFDRRDVHYVAAWRHPHGALTGLPNLEAIFSLGAGVDHLLADDKLPDVPVYRVIDDNLTAQMGEYVVWQCLSHLRRARLYDQQQKQSLWFDQRPQPCASDVRVGVMGLGVMGQDSLAKLKIIGFQVAGWSRTPKTLNNIQTFAGLTELEPFLHQSDILVCLLPLTAETRGILNRSIFLKLARNGALGGPFVINAGRGGLQIESDILACLEDGTLQAVTLDVFEKEPLPSESPLWLHPKVIITPHNAAVSNPDHVTRFVVENINRLENDTPAFGFVDRSAGY